MGKSETMRWTIEALGTSVQFTIREHIFCILVHSSVNFNFGECESVSQVVKH